MAKDEKLFDSRTVQRNIALGLVTEEEYEAYLKNLPDEEPNGIWTALDFEDAELHSGANSGGESGSNSGNHSDY